MIITEDMLNAKTTDDLSDLLFDYTHRNMLSFASADEILIDVLNQIEKLQVNARWLQGFIKVWNDVQATEDFVSAIAARGER